MLTTHRSVFSTATLLLLIAGVACNLTNDEEDLNQTKAALVGSTIATVEAASMTTKTPGVGALACNGACWELLGNGYIESAITFPSNGTYDFDITAFADIAAGAGARLELRIDQVAVASTIVTATSLQSVHLQSCVGAGDHRVAIAFTNDYYEPQTGIDRNLYIGKLTIAPVTSSTIATLPAASMSIMPTTTVGARSCNGDCWKIMGNGYVEGTVQFPSPGSYGFDVLASADVAGGSGAKMELRLDGSPVASVMVDATSLTTFPLTANVPTGGAHRVGIAFTNDFYDPTSGADRNLNVGNVTVSTNTCASTPASTAGKIENFNAASSSRFQVDGKEVATANAEKSWSLVKIDDYTLEMSCHEGDHWETWGYSDPYSVNRSEVEFTEHYLAGQQITVTEKITIMPGPISTAGHVDINQLHTELNSPPSGFTFQLEQNTDHLEVVLQSPSNYWFRPWRDTQPVVRGKEYDFKAVMTMGSNGKVDVWLDGVQIVNYRGSVGASSGGYYWKWGNYRGNAPEVLTIRHKNMHIVVD